MLVTFDKGNPQQLIVDLLTYLMFAVGVSSLAEQFQADIFVLNGRLTGLQENHSAILRLVVDICPEGQSQVNTICMSLGGNYAVEQDSWNIIFVIYSFTSTIRHFVTQ